MAGTDVAARIKSIEDQIAQAEKDAAERDADGDPTLAAMRGQKNLASLYKQLIDWTRLAGQSSSSAGSPISAPSSQKTIIMQYADGTRSEIPNPNYVDDSQERAADLDLRRAQVASQYASANAAGAGAAATIQAAMIADARERAKMEQNAQQDAITNLLNQQQINLEEAKAAMAEVNNRISARLKAEENAIKQKGDAMAFGQNIATNTVSAWNNAMPFMVPQGFNEQFASTLDAFRTGKLPEFKAFTAPFPYDPNTLAINAAAQGYNAMTPGELPPGATFKAPMPPQLELPDPIFTPQPYERQVTFRAPGM